MGQRDESGPDNKAEFNVDDKSKKHHFVPRFLLENFVEPQLPNKLYVFDKLKHISFKSAVIDAGCENNFNKVEVDGQTVNFEGVFQTSDSQFALVISDILRNRSLANISQKDRLAISEAVAVQMLRTKMARTTLRSVAEQLGTSLKAAGFDLGKVEGVSPLTEEDARKVALASLGDMGKIVDALQGKQMVLVHNSALGPFWISDNPVVFHHSSPYGKLGVAQKGIQISFPISQDYVIGFYCPSVMLKIGELVNSGQFPEMRDIAQLYTGITKSEPVSLGPETVPFLNSIQVFSSSRFLYAPSDDFALAKRIITDHPHVQSIQSLVTVGQMGKGPGPNERMPAGLWVVFYGKRSHHLLKVESWNENAGMAMEFETCDAKKLEKVLNDQPIETATMYANKLEREFMRNVKLIILNNQFPIKVQVKFLEEGLNRIRENRIGRPPTGGTDG